MVASQNDAHILGLRLHSPLAWHMPLQWIINVRPFRAPLAWHTALQRIINVRPLRPMQGMSRFGLQVNRKLVSSPSESGWQETQLSVHMSSRPNKESDTQLEIASQTKTGQIWYAFALYPSISAKKKLKFEKSGGSVNFWQTPIRPLERLTGES